MKHQQSRLVIIPTTIHLKSGYKQIPCNWLTQMSPHCQHRKIHPKMSFLASTLPTYIDKLPILRHYAYYCYHFHLILLQLQIQILKQRSCTTNHPTTLVILLLLILYHNYYCYYIIIQLKKKIILIYNIPH